MLHFSLPFDSVMATTKRCRLTEKGSITRKAPNRPGSYRRPPETLQVRFCQSQQGLALGLRADQPPQMDDAAADRDVAAAEIGPRLLLQPRHQLEPDLPIRFVVLVHSADHRGQCLDQVGAADDPDELTVSDYRDAFDAFALEQRGDL